MSRSFAVSPRRAAACGPGGLHELHWDTQQIEARHDLQHDNLPLASCYILVPARTSQKYCAVQQSNAAGMQSYTNNNAKLVSQSKRRTGLYAWAVSMSRRHERCR